MEMQQPVKGGGCFLCGKRIEEQTIYGRRHHNHTLKWYLLMWCDDCLGEFQNSAESLPEFLNRKKVPISTTTR